MATGYPAAIDAWSNPTSTTAMNAAGFEHDILHSNAQDAIEAIEAELGTLPKGSFATVKARLNDIDTRFAQTFTRSPYVTVASNEMSSTVKAACDYSCDGVDDQVQINNAMDKASRIADALSGAEGWGAVHLVGTNFFIGNNGASVKLRPNVKLMGSGPGTVLRSAFSSGYTGGIVEVLNGNVSRAHISDLSIGAVDYTHVPGSGIKLVTNDEGATYDLKSGSDNFIRISRVNIFAMSERAIWLQGGREIQIDNVHCQNPILQGIFLDGHSDAKIHRVVVNGIDGTEAGIDASSAGNSQITDCKVFYRGNKSGGTAVAGFRIATSRITIANCQAQDNGGWGFNITGNDVTASNLLADSNSAQSASLGGFHIAANGVYNGLYALDRGQTPSSPQVNGFTFEFSPQVFLTGKANIPSGSSWVSSTAGANSYVRIVRNGTTIYSQG